MSNETELPIAFWIAYLVAFPFLLAGMFALILWVLSKVSGWSALAERFRAEGKPKGRRVGGTVMMNMVSYNFVLNLRVGEEGLHLSSALIQRFNPPLFIPWSAIADCTRTNMLLGTVTSVTVGSPRVTLWIGSGAGVAIHREWEAWRARRKAGAAGDTGSGTLDRAPGARSLLTGNASASLLASLGQPVPAPREEAREPLPEPRHPGRE